MGAQMPEPPERGCKPKQIPWTRTRPLQCHTKIIVVSFECGERSCLVFDSLLVSALSNGKVMAKVSLAGILFLTRFDEPVGAVLPQSFEQPIPQLIVVNLFHCHQRLVHELLNTIERIALRPDRFDRSQTKAAGENR
jgi:hypothetical protein